MSVDPRYYPSTDVVEWAPLHKALCGGWMFMGVEDGRFYYKHHTTRAYLIVDEDGNVVQDQRTGGES